ncbi:MAG: DUF3810 domain-containing protein [Clostridiales bacterium]|nr:DUF3810 domain-containing protein [Clostridiales bacterium]
MSVFKENRGLHRWLLIAAGVWIAFLLARNSRPLMNWFISCVTEPFKRGLAAVCYLTDVSVAEVWYAVVITVTFFYITRAVRHVIAAKKKWRMVYRYVLGLACAGLTIYTGFCLLWGVNYYTDDFQQQSGVYAEAVAAEDLKNVTAYFAQELSQSADTVQRDENGLFAESQADIFADSTRVYENSYGEFPCLKMQDRAPKAVTVSTIMSALDFTGFYFPFTGEANVNVDSPASFLPSTIAHELAHQRGIASEQECNFIAIVTSTTCDSAAYRYSGWLLGYIHLGNALYQADQEAWRAIRSSLPENVIKDMAYNNAYWAQYEGLTASAASKVYDSFLKGYGETAGIQSYGTVVDMLVAYYR